jgi:pilus assembly protein CpaB
MPTGSRFWIVVGVSLMWALLVSGVFYRLAGRARTPARSAEPEKPLVVAAVALPFGALLARDSVQLRSTPERLFPAGGFSRIEEVIDRPVISPIEAGEAVVEARISARGSGMGLAPMIPSGMRAIAVRVNDVAGVAGFILPGTRVDVLVTGRPPGYSDTFTRTVLQNVIVLSAGQTLQSDGKNPAINTPVVTLLVSPADAEAMTLATNEGHIQLVLRNSTDREVARTAGRQLHDLYGSGLDAPRPTPPEPIVASVRKPAPKPAPPPLERPVVTPTAAPVPVAAEAPAPAADAVMLIRGSVKTLETPPPLRNGPQ